jgi:Tfp pilus assembly protein PilV
MSIKLYKKSKGIGLVETILALGIAVVVITALVSLAVYTLRSSQQSKYLLEGSKLAAEHVELLRIYKDSGINWTDFVNAVSGCTTPCSTDGSAVASNPATITLSNSATVQRYFTVDTSVVGVVRVTSVVEWPVGPVTKKTTVITDITNWRGDP